VDWHPTTPWQLISFFYLNTNPDTRTFHFGKNKYEMK
jgi:hypothetical protein